LVLARIDLGHRIRAARQQRRWSQEALGRRSGLARHVILDCELGSRKIEAFELQAIARALGTSMEALLGTPDEEQLPAWLRELAARASPRQLELMGTFGEFLLWQAEQDAQEVPEQPATSSTNG
jgi:transcriptional regulator with XRE-family HTH domain